MSQAEVDAISLFGLSALPQWVPADEGVEYLMHEVYEGTWILIALLAIGYTAMALHQNFGAPDNVLRRMWFA